MAKRSPPSASAARLAAISTKPAPKPASTRSPTASNSSRCGSLRSSLDELPPPTSLHSGARKRGPGGGRETSFVHLVARHDAPEIGGGRVLGPHLWALRIIAVPRPRLEIAELLVHAVELGEQFGDQAGRAAMISKEVMADAVAARAPQQLVAVDG